MSDEGSFGRRVFGVQLWIWLIAVVVVLVVGPVVLLVAWTIVASAFIVDRAWWAWNGWVAVAAVAQIVAAGAVLATLWFFWQQLKGIREQARKDFELRNTPLISITPIGGGYTEPDGITVDFRLNLDGNGVAYNVVINMLRTDVAGQIHAQPHLIRYALAPGQEEFGITWQDSEMRSWPNDPRQTRPVKVEVAFINIFNHRIRFQHTGTLDVYRGLRIGDAPKYLDLVGREVKLGD